MPENHAHDSKQAAFDEQATLGPAPGEAIGPADDFGERFRVMERLGTGGFGDVYMAEQLAPVRRRVAIKVIKLGMDTREVIARFEAERQALAMMDHPAIARVLDAGATTTGRPFFVMELVRGVPLTEFCDKQQLSVQDRIALFIEVCAAVQHAHQKGVIHRDLKPSNILVAFIDGKPAPKVIDFGIAKATAGSLTERTMHTTRGEFIGTPQYMAPEQADDSVLDIDTRADIYSLGAVLYELLTGVTPVDAKTLREAGRAAIPHLVATQEAPRASTRLSSMGEQVEEIARLRRETAQRLRRALRGELDWILLKALEKDRRRRYDTANALAMDLQRHLDDEPVLASPPSARYRAGKFVRRHRAGVAVAATIALAVVGSGAFATASYFEVRRERDASERARGEAEAVTAFLVETLGAASPRELGREVTVREAMDQAAQRVAGAFESRPSVEASLRDAIGKTYIALGEMQAAGPHFDRALALRREAFGERDARTLASMRSRADGLHAIGLFDDALRVYEETLAAQRATLGDDDPETVQTTVSLGMLHAEAGRLEQADAMLEEAERMRSLTDGPMSIPTLTVTNMRAVVLAEMGQFDRAEALLTRVIDGLTAARGEEYADALSARSNLVWLRTQLGRYDEAIALGEATLPVTRRVFGDEHIETLTIENNLAVAYRQTGRFDDAEPLLRHDLEVSRRVLGDRHPDTLVSINNMGRFYYESGRMEEAERLYAEAVSSTREVMGTEFIGLGISSLGYGRTLVALGKHAEAEPALLEAHRILRAQLGPQDRGVAIAAETLATVYTALGRPDEAAKWAATAGSE
jgi:non-specific serine/threonine protein kinase/serine/threonine-protein kinase